MPWWLYQKNGKMNKVSRLYMGYQGDNKGYAMDLRNWNGSKKGKLSLTHTIPEKFERSCVGW